MYGKRTLCPRSFRNTDKDVVNIGTVFLSNVHPWSRKFLADLLYQTVLL